MTLLQDAAARLGELTVQLAVVETGEAPWPYAVVLVDPDTGDEIWRCRFATREAAESDFARRRTDYPER